MYYISDNDLEYIKNKYHDTSKEFNSFNRFICNDDIYDENSGISSEQIKKDILSRDESFKDYGHAVRKSKAFEYVLENMRIDVNPHDYFPSFHSMDRPINKTLVAKWIDEVFIDTIPEINNLRNWYGKYGLSTIWPDYDHSVPIWDRLIKYGFGGILKISEQYRAKRKNLTGKQEDFFDGIKITYEAILKLIDRLIDFAQKRSEKSEKTLEEIEALKRLRYGVPETMYDVLLMIYIYFILSEHIGGLQVRSLSNIDVVLYPFYKKDIERGTVTEEQQRKYIAYFLYQYQAIGNYWNQPVYFGGTKADGASEINELSYIILDVYDKMKLYNPKLQLKFSENTPVSFVKKALDMIRRGHNSIVFVCEKTMMNALLKQGVTKEEARKCRVNGCYEYDVQEALGIGMMYLSLLKPLELVMHNGKDGVTGDKIGLETVDGFECFDDLYDAYKKQLINIISGVINTENQYEQYLCEINPQPMLNATFESCLEKAKDIFDGGAKYNSTTMQFGFVANIADSLSMIKKYVFDKKIISLEELTNALDSNWEGYEKLRKMLLLDEDKYVNNRELPDYFAKDITTFAAEFVNIQKNSECRGGTWVAGCHVARQSYSMAANHLASPDGRALGDELSKNVSASMGQNRNGVTAAVMSATKLDATLLKGDACLDVGLLPSAVMGDDGLEAMYGLLKTFEKRGGHAINFNVFNAEKLREAQKYPDMYSDLQIRVCGWNVLFNNINKEEQDGFIKQAEALV